MSAALDQPTRDKLMKLLGMLGTDHDGERSVFALKAHQIVKGLGLSWNDVLVYVPPPREESRPTQAGKGAAPRWNSDSWRDTHRLCLEQFARLSEWERHFVTIIGGRGYLTTRQEELLERIARKLGLVS